MHLKTISNEDERFVLLDLDKPWQLAEAVGLKRTEANYQQHLIKLIQLAGEVLTEKTTGVVLGPKAGYEAINSKTANTGLVLSLDDNFYPHDPFSLPQFLPDWGVEHIKNNYGVIKLNLFYNPQEKLANEKNKLLVEVYDYAQYEKLDLVVELNIVLDGKLKPKDKREVFLTTQLNVVRELQNMVDLFILEYPFTSLACATLTAELDVPWIMNDQSIKYTELKNNLRIALEGGASGLMMGRNIFREAPQFDKRKVDEFFNLWRKFLNTEGRDRVLELARITQEVGLMTDI